LLRHFSALQQGHPHRLLGIGHPAFFCDSDGLLMLQVSIVRWNVHVEMVMHARFQPVGHFIHSYAVLR
jgi:hypothetical protein